MPQSLLTLLHKGGGVALRMVSRNLRFPAFEFEGAEPVPCEGSPVAGLQLDAAACDPSEGSPAGGLPAQNGALRHSASMVCCKR